MPASRRPRSFASHAATYAIGNIARRFVGFAMLPIYTRFLTPADYGVVGLLTFALAIFETLLGARVGAAVPKFFADADSSRDRRSVIWGTVALAGAASTLSVVVIIGFRGLGAQLLFGTRHYAFDLALFSINLVSQPIAQTGMTYLRLKGRSGLFFWFSMSKLALQVALNLLLVVYWREAVFGVVLSGVISSVLFAIVITGYVATQEAPVFDWSITRRMLDYSWPLWFSGLAGLYISSSGSVFLRAFSSLSDVGLLSLALRFATVVGVLIWGPFYSHWEPLSFQYHKEGSAPRKFQVAFIVISALLFSGGLGISIFSTPIINVMAARSFDAAAIAVPILTLGFILNSIRQFFNFSFFATGTTKVYSLCQYGTAVVITVAYFALIPKFGFVGAAIAQTVAFAVNFIYLRVISRRYLDLGLSMMPLVMFTVIGVIAYGVANVVVHVPWLALDLAIKTVVSLTAIALIAWVALRAVLSVEGESLDTLPWPLDRLGRMRLGWLGRQT